MKKNILKIINILVAISFLGLILSVLFNDFLPGEMFEEVHPKIGFLFLILTFCHIYLNFNWIKSNFLKH